VLPLAVSIPEKVSSTLESGVEIMLMFLGATTLTGLTLAGSCAVYEERGIVHSHDHNHPHHDHRHWHKSMIIVGMIHGMVGSGALMLVVLSTISSIPLGLAYITIFGAGSIASMAAK
jgi:hypothetical protein